MATQEAQLTIIWIPGLMHGPVFFDPIKTTLATKGVSSIAVDMPNYGQERAAIAAEYDDVKAARATVERVVEQGVDVVLVSHSYGGIVAAQAVRGFTKTERVAAGKPGGIVNAVWMAAFVLPDQMSTWKFLQGNLPPVWARRDGDVWYPNTDIAAQQFFADLPPVEATTWARKLVPASHNHCTAPINGACWGMDVSKTYITTKQDPSLPVFIQEAMMAEMKDATWSFREIDSAHAPFLSKKDELANMLIELGRLG